MVEMVNVGEEIVPAGTLMKVSGEGSTPCRTEEGLISCRIEEISLISIVSAGRSLGDLYSYRLLLSSHLVFLSLPCTPLLFSVFPLQPSDVNLAKFLIHKLGAVVKLQHE